MFFSGKIKNIKQTDHVLEIGPGGTPHPRSNVLLEKKFDNPDEAEGQRGFAPPLKDSYKGKVVYYDGGRFPFQDKEFDYVICSHVLEHIEEVDFFISEITRVGNKGYLEYPTIYYDYIYNFQEHKTLLFRRENILYYMPKKESGLYFFMPVNILFYESLKSGYVELIEILKPWMFQGFEWTTEITIKKSTSIGDLTYTYAEIKFPPNDTFRIIKRIISSLRQIHFRK
ncbi:MAG: methyltransferase domain-containing protein [Deltaproteobacteria bacterium]|nr:MAG: methyltransferase domain-containing protein [Deltaproteobacteria bacterium]